MAGCGAGWRMNWLDVQWRLGEPLVGSFVESRVRSGISAHSALAYSVA